MLTRLKVSGFKNLLDVDVRFGPFTCIAGTNGVGKSNLFDAIQFLSALADRPLLEAALSIRGRDEPASDPRRIFLNVGDERADEITLEAEMIVPRHGIDDLGQEAEASSTFLRYRLAIGYREEPSPAGPLTILDELLTYTTVTDAPHQLRFPHTPSWRESVISNRRRTAGYITKETRGDDGTSYILLHQDGHAGRQKSYVAENLPRTILSSADALESPTALLARREMQSWRLLQLEPSALRRADSYRDAGRIDERGAHLPATLARLAGGRPGARSDGAGSGNGVYAKVANRLAELIEGVASVRVEDDARHELLTLILTDTAGTDHVVRSLSDGTLRFLALSTLAVDPSVLGLLCLEEPENGIHPGRIPSMIEVLRDLSTDTDEPVGEDNPLRQVLVNTHSPAVVQHVPEDALLAAVLQHRMWKGKRFLAPAFQWLPDTWRCEADPERPTVAIGQLLAYLNPGGVESARHTLDHGQTTRSRRKVKDRFTSLMPFMGHDAQQ